MKYKNGQYIAIHTSPIWREKSNFIFMACQSSIGEEIEWEQMWGDKVAPNEYIICCIPFFVYGLSLGDVVELNENFILQKVIRKSNYSTFRIWFGECDEEKKMEITYQLECMNIAMEWSSTNLLAVSPQKNEAQRVADYLAHLESTGLIQYETGDQ